MLSSRFHFPVPLPALEPSSSASRRRLCHDFQNVTASTAGSTLALARDAFSRARISVTGSAPSIFLGNATADVVQQLGIHPAIAGWILGVVTSTPEMVSFFTVYAAATREGRLQDLNDTQEVLDNLTGSNMANVGVVYPVGLLAFLLGSSLLGAG